MRVYGCTMNEDGGRVLTVDGRELPIIRWYAREEWGCYPGCEYDDFVLTLLWDLYQMGKWDPDAEHPTLDIPPPWEIVGAIKLMRVPWTLTAEELWRWIDVISPGTNGRLFIPYLGLPTWTRRH